MSKAYDAEEFKARANIKTRNVWFLLNLLLTAQYCSNVTKGTYESKYIVPFYCYAGCHMYQDLYILRLRERMHRFISLQ